MAYTKEQIEKYKEILDNYKQEKLNKKNTTRGRGLE